jgi:hypothetical protein
MQFQAAAMSRADVDASERPDFCLYVDEFQNYATDSFATILSEARKFGLNLIVANQFTTQLTDEIRDAVFGNVGTIVSFRVGTQDADALQKVMQPIFDSDDLQRIPNGNMVVRTLIRGIPTQPFSMQGLPPLGNDNQKLVQALIQLSAAKYGRPRAQVEAEIFERLAVKESVKPSESSSNPLGAPGVPPLSASPKAPPKQPSFLDEWLAKRPAAGLTKPGAQPAATVPVKPPTQQPVKSSELPVPQEPQRPLGQAHGHQHKAQDKKPESTQKDAAENITKEQPKPRLEPEQNTTLSLADQLKKSLETHRVQTPKAASAPVPTSTPKGVVVKNKNEGELSHDDTLQIR